MSSSVARVGVRVVSAIACCAIMAGTAAAQCTSEQVYIVDVTVSMVDGQQKANDPGLQPACEGDTILWRIENQTTSPARVVIRSFKRKANPGSVYPLLGPGVYDATKAVPAGSRKIILGEVPKIYSDLSGHTYKYTIAVIKGAVTDPELQITEPPPPPPPPPAPTPPKGGTVKPATAPSKRPPAPPRKDPGGQD